MNDFTHVHNPRVRKWQQPETLVHVDHVCRYDDLQQPPPLVLYKHLCNIHCALLKGGLENVSTHTSEV